jgi:WD40 repeat protein
LIALLEGHTNQITSAAFSPDDTYVVTSSFDGQSAIWTTRSGKLLGPVGHGGDVVMWATFAPDGGTVLNAIGDGAALWDVAIERRSPDEVAREVACRDPYRLETERLLPAQPLCGTER